MATHKDFDVIIDVLRKMGRFTLIPSAGYLDEGFLMESIYTFLDKAKLPYIIKKVPDETDEQVVLCGANIEQVKTLLANKNTKQIVFLPNHYLNERLSTLLDERCTLFCHDRESFNSFQKSPTEAKIYLSDNLAFSMKLKMLECPSKEANKIPLGKRYLIWHLASLFIQKMKLLKSGKDSYLVGYFLKESTLPNAVDISECYQGNFVYRPLTKWLATLFIGIIKAPDIVVTNMFSVALMAEQLGKTVFTIQDSHAREIRYTKLDKSGHVFPISPQQNVENNIRSILQTIYCTKNGNLKPFQKMNPIPEADIKLKPVFRKVPKDMLRLFYVTSEYIDINTFIPYPGGLAQYLCKITTELVKLRHDVNVLVINSPTYKKIMYQGVSVIFVPSTPGRMYQDISNILQTEHKRKKIDLIQYASFFALGRFPEREIPSCVRISSYAKLWQKYYGYDNPQEIEYETEQFRKSRFLYGPSISLAQYIKEDLNLKKKIQIIETPFIPYQGPEDKTLYKELASRINGAPYLLFYGRVCQLKGAKEIADIIKQILKKYPHLYFVFIGSQIKIEDKLPIDIICQKAGKYANRIIWFNKQPHQKLFPIIRHTKAVILPSRVDNLPNTCIEAMGLKKIVIGSRGASFEQLIIDGKNGLLCQAGDANSLLQAIDRLMNLTDEEISCIEEQAYKRSLQLYPEIIIPKVLRYYKYVIKKWNKK